MLVNRYERDRNARDACIQHYGPRCTVCALEFEARYGEIGRGFIHVHHTVPVSRLGEEYTVDPIEDLVPMCPNCHAMLHRRNPPYSVSELKSALEGRPKPPFQT
ncbi:HNH endonuclease [Marinobacter sp. THAF197a]|uniref:HNH endonuclease n=1 Tax=unclassified Marinobacter TaxID=83889 RepID=UPI003A5CF58D